MEPTAGRLRSDLLISRQRSQGVPVVVVKDPATGRFFRLRELEFSIAERLDGRTPLEVVRRGVEEHYGTAFAPGALEQFTAKLGRLGLLETAASAPRTDLVRSTRLQGDLFYLRYALLDPDGLLDRMVARLGFCFTPAFFAATVALLAVAGGVALANSHEIARDMLRLMHLHVLALAWVTVIAVTAVHEFAHGLTCKRFGGRVRNMGVLLIYFQPAFYCDVSDAWLFPEKSRRLFVTFAGAYVEIVLIGLATLVWRITDPGTSVNSAALIVMGTSAIKTLFNLNPLIKLDGYYLLSDYVEIPNLRRRAFAYIGERCRALLGIAPLCPITTTKHERRTYLAYGLLAAGYSTWLLASVALWVGARLVERYQGAGALAFVALLAAIFRRPLRDYGRRLLGERHAGRSTVRTMIEMVVALMIGLFVFFGHAELKVGGEFKILPAHNADVRAQVEGFIDAIHVDEGDVVNPGDAIATISRREIGAEIQKIEAQIAEKEAFLRKLRVGTRSEEIDLARTTVAKTRERLKYATQQLDRQRALYADQLISRREFEDVEEQVMVRQKELEEARGNLDLLLAGSRPEEIEAVQAEIARMESERRYLEDELARVRLVSPVAGVVTTPHLKEKLGEHVVKGDLIAEVHELETVTAEIAVPEKEIGAVRRGQNILLKARAYPGRSFDGVVAAIAPTAKELDDDPGRVVMVRTSVANGEGLLKPEMTGNAKIYCGERSILDLVTRRLARFIRVEFWSWW